MDARPLGFALLVTLAAGRPALADDAPPPRRSLFAQAAQPDAEPADPPPVSIDYFGKRNSSRLTLGSRVAPDFDGHIDTGLFAQLTYFIDTDIEVGAEIAGWAIFQNDDTVAGSFSLLGRYHFYQQPTYSLFLEASLGLFLAGDNVPDTGTSYNLLPRLGVGGTYQLTDDGQTRLIGGIHWHHISNARSSGANRNPSRDAVGLYFGVNIEL